MFVYDAVMNSLLAIAALATFVALIVLLAGAMSHARVLDKALVWLLAVGILVGGSWSTVCELYGMGHSVLIGVTVHDRVRVLASLVAIVCVGVYAALIQWRFHRDHRPPAPLRHAGRLLCNANGRLMAGTVR